MDVSTVIVICLITTGIAAAIARSKHTPVGQAFVVGALLSIIGIIIVAVAPPGLLKAPAGMTAVKCPRCNMIQNVAEEQRNYQCWQCKYEHERWAAPTPWAEPAPPSMRSVPPASRLRCHSCGHTQSVPALLSGALLARCCHQFTGSSRVLGFWTNPQLNCGARYWD